MSICGNCHYNWHSDTECDYDCDFEDAVYREQEAYDSLREEYDALIKRYDELYDWCQTGGYPMPFSIEPYTEAESKTRDTLDPAFWTRRDWIAYSEEIKPVMDAIEALNKIGEVYPISAEETAAALKIAGEATIQSWGEVGKAFKKAKENLDNDNKI